MFPYEFSLETGILVLLPRGVLWGLGSDPLRRLTGRSTPPPQETPWAQGRDCWRRLRLPLC